MTISLVKALTAAVMFTVEPSNCASFVGEPLDHVLAASSAGLGEEGIHGSTATLVRLVVHRANGGHRCPEGIIGPVILIPLAILARGCIQSR
jgi:hypothetical protein